MTGQPGGAEDMLELAAARAGVTLYQHDHHLELEQQREEDSESSPQQRVTREVDLHLAAVTGHLAAITQHIEAIKKY